MLTKENVSEWIPLIKALESGRLQVAVGENKNEWVDTNSMATDIFPSYYRVKPINTDWMTKYDELFDVSKMSPSLQKALHVYDMAMDIAGYIHLDLYIDHQAEEKQTRDCPGCPQSDTIVYVKGEYTDEFYNLDADCMAELSNMVDWLSYQDESRGY